MRVLTISKITRQDSSSKQLHDCSLMLHYWVKYFFKKHSDDFQDQTKQKVKQTTKTKAKVQRNKRMQKKYCNAFKHSNVSLPAFIGSGGLRNSMITTQIKECERNIAMLQNTATFLNYTHRLRRPKEMTRPTPQKKNVKEILQCFKTRQRFLTTLIGSGGLRK